MSRVRVILLNAALGPLDYRLPHGAQAEPGAIVLAPLGPRQLTGVVWEPERAPTEEIGDNRLRPLLQVYDLPPLAEPLRRLIEWTSDYYLAPLASVLRMSLASASALDGARTVTEYRPTGRVPERLTPQRSQALERIDGRQGLVRELGEGLFTALLPGVGEALRFGEGGLVAQALAAAAGINFEGLRLDVARQASDAIYRAVGREEAAIRADPSSVGDVFLRAALTEEELRRR